MEERNFLKRTISYLEGYGKTPEDVVWVGVKPHYWFNDNPWQTGTWEDFALLADQDAPQGFSSDGSFIEGTDINMGLVIVGKDFWLERHMNDEFGSAWWEFKSILIKPVDAEPLQTFIREDHREVWVDLEYNRASGQAICENCAKPYSRHPEHKDESWLNVLCDGRLVKL